MPENRRDSRAHMDGERWRMYSGLPDNTTYTEYPLGANPMTDGKQIFLTDLRGPPKWRYNLETTDPERMSDDDEWVQDVRDAMGLLPPVYSRTTWSKKRIEGASDAQ